MKFYTLFLLAMLLSSAVVMAETPTDSGAHLKGAVTIKPEPVMRTAGIKKEAEISPEEKPTEKSEDSETPDEAVKEQPQSYIGDEEVITAKFEDTILELGRKYNLGYVEMVAANPGIDPWLPGDGTKIILPKRHLLPDAPREGIVINLAEMRLYNYLHDTNHPITHPLGIGRDGLNTPLGVTKIVRKKEGPTWRPTERMRREKPELPVAVPPGEDNPLGTHALYLGWPQYLIHGTHKPLGVGRRVSSGCIRMYPEDIITTFADVPVGTKVTVIKQPVKLGWIDGMLYLEAHAEDELADSYEDIGTIKEYRVPETLFKDLATAAGDQKSRLDWQKIREAVKSRTGMPVAILKSSGNNQEVTEDILKQDQPEIKKQKYNKQPRKFNS